MLFGLTTPCAQCGCQIGYENGNCAAGCSVRCRGHDKDSRDSQGKCTNCRLFRSAKWRASKKNLKFNLTVSWLNKRLAKGVCEVTGIPFSKETGHWARPSIHRVIPGGPYTKKNCQMVIWLYNQAIGAYAYEDLMTLCRALVEKECSLPSEESDTSSGS